MTRLLLLFQKEKYLFFRHFKKKARDFWVKDQSITHGIGCLLISETEISNFNENNWSEMKYLLFWYISFILFGELRSKAAS
jgi:hypothetical protein